MLLGKTSTFNLPDMDMLDDYARYSLSHHSYIVEEQ